MEPSGVEHSGAAGMVAPEPLASPAGPSTRPGGLVLAGSTLAGRLLPLAVLLAAGVGVALRDPHQHGSWGVCPTYAIFGVYCPGCGSLRGLNDLQAGRLAESVGHNALIIPAILFLVLSVFRRPGRAWSYVWLGLFLVFTVARNIPGSPLAP